MTTSGTYLTQPFDIARVFDTVARRCGITPDRLTPEAVNIMRDNLYLQFLEWGNRGANLWCIGKIRLGLTQYQPVVVLPRETIDVLGMNRSKGQRLTPVAITSSDGGTAANAADEDLDTVCTQTAPDGNVMLEFSGSPVVAVVGVQFGSAATFAVAFEVSADGLTWELAKSVASASYADREWLWVEFQTPVARNFLRLRVTGGTLAVREIYACAQTHEVPMSRLNRQEYFALPNKQFPGDPLQFWMDRQIQPQVTLWPVPRDPYSHLVALRHRHIQDPGALTNDLEVPPRWFECVSWDLALRAIHELPGADLNRVPLIEKQAGLHLLEAETEERDASPFSIAPRIRAYTR